MPWDAIAKVLVAVLVLVGGFFGVRGMGNERRKRKQAEADREALNQALDVSRQPVPTDLGDIGDGLRRK
jgi:hypothetical protein